MKIILWSINYAPEPTGIAPYNRELAEFLASRGHDVSAVTTFPYYPQWRKEPGDLRRWHRAEVVGAVHVHRCWCYVPAVATSFRRILHELSFGVVSALRLIALPRADVYVVVSPPLGLGFFAWVVTALKGSRYVFHVQDLQPDAAVRLGMIRQSWLVRALYGLERLAYAKAMAVSGISKGMIAAFQRKGVPAGKCVLLPNWLRLAVPTRGRDRAADRRSFGVAPDAMLAIYSGNLGRKQDLDVLIKAAALIPAGRPALHVIIAGFGAARADLEACLREHPYGGVELLPLLDDDRYAALLNAADVALITQAAGTGQFFFPSKLLSVLAAGLPVVAVADVASELARAVRSGEFGVVVSPGNAAGLAIVLHDLAQSRGQLTGWAEHTDWVQQFSREAILPRFENMLLMAARNRRVLPAVEPRAPAPA